MTHDEQIAKLNRGVKIRIAPSKVHGVGVFAMRDIRAGEALWADAYPELYDLPYERFGELREDVRQLLLERWPNIVNGSKFLYPDSRLMAYMNHSDTPNYDSINDFVLLDIKAGEEITEDYKKIPNYAQVFPWIDKKPKKRGKIQP